MVDQSWRKNILRNELTYLYILCYRTIRENNETLGILKNEFTLSILATVDTRVANLMLIETKR